MIRFRKEPLSINSRYKNVTAAWGLVTLTENLSNKKKYPQSLDDFETSLTALFEYTWVDF